MPPDDTTVPALTCVKETARRDWFAALDCLVKVAAPVRGPKDCAVASHCDHCLGVQTRDATKTDATRSFTCANRVLMRPTGIVNELRRTDSRRQKIQKGDRFHACLLLLVRSLLQNQAPIPDARTGALKRPDRGR